MSNDVLTFHRAIPRPAPIRNGFWRWRNPFHTQVEPYDVWRMSTPISYAPPLARYRQGRYQTILIRVLIVAAVTCASAWGFRFIQQLHFLVLERQAMQFTMSPERIIVAEGNAQVALLAKLPDYRAFQRTSFDSPAGVPVVASELPSKMTDAALASHWCAFLHERRAAGRPERIVAVNVQATGDGYQLCASTSRPAGLRIGSRPVDCIANAWAGNVPLPAGRSFLLFAGQPDSADESHFTFRCDRDGKSTIIDGWLMEDDTVQLQPRK